MDIEKIKRLQEKINGIIEGGDYVMITWYFAEWGAFDFLLNKKQMPDEYLTNDDKMLLYDIIIDKFGWSRHDPVIPIGNGLLKIQDNKLILRYENDSNELIETADIKYQESIEIDHLLEIKEFLTEEKDFYLTFWNKPSEKNHIDILSEVIKEKGKGFKNDSNKLNSLIFENIKQHPEPEIAYKYHLYGKINSNYVVLSGSYFEKYNPVEKIKNKEIILID